FTFRAELSPRMGIRGLDAKRKRTGRLFPIEDVLGFLGGFAAFVLVNDFLQFLLSDIGEAIALLSFGFFRVSQSLLSASELAGRFGLGFGLALLTGRSHGLFFRGRFLLAGYQNGVGHILAFVGHHQRGHPRNELHGRSVHVLPVLFVGPVILPRFREFLQGM